MIFKPDQPIESSNHDVLGRHEFAIALANAISSHEDKNSIVVGLYGTWGSGKTSIINMVKECISTVSDKKKESEKPVILNFNPWNYSDQNQLISQFFNELSIALKRSDVAGEFKNIGETFEAYASFFEPLVLMATTDMGGSVAVAGLKGLRWVAKLGKFWGKKKSKDLSEVRKDLNKLLEKMSRKNNYHY